MNQSFNSLIVGALMLGALPSAFAASSTDLTVTGSIIPGACTPSLSSANVDFGKTSAADLSPALFTLLGRQYLTLTINCPASMQFAIKGTDRRPDTHDSAGLVSPYGFGLTPAGEKIGSYFLHIRPRESNIDGNAVFLTVGNAAATQWSSSSTQQRAIFNYGELLGLVDRAGVISGPSPITNAVLSVEVAGYVAPADRLTLKEEITLDGEATLTVVYI